MNSFAFHYPSLDSINAPAPLGCTDNMTFWQEVLPPDISQA